MAYIDDPQTQKANYDYIKNSMNAPMLEKEHEQNLARRFHEQGDEKALHELVSSYTRLVVSIASRFRNYGLPMGDLIQEGNVGLMMAAERFDVERDVRFSTYASWWIRSQIQDYILRNWSIVRTGTTSAQKSLFFNLRRLRTKIENRNEQEGLGEDGREEVAKELGVNVNDVRHMETRMFTNDQSLNAKISSESDSEWESLLADEGPTPEDIVMGVHDAKTRSAWLNKALKGLSDREEKIIRQRHLGEAVVTLEDLGKDLGISKERVRQLEQRAMEKLKISMSQLVDDKNELFADSL
jgi:RNA polymerase sigma-32 factor